jgi:hypothetical protein
MINSRESQKQSQMSAETDFVGSKSTAEKQDTRVVIKPYKGHISHRSSEFTKQEQQY